MNISVDIIKLCRLCQVNIGIWSISESGLIEKIKECTKIDLYDDGKQLFKICSECKETINEFFQYLQRIYKADFDLKQRNEQYNVGVLKSCNNTLQNHPQHSIVTIQPDIVDLGKKCSNEGKNKSELYHYYILQISLLNVPPPKDLDTDSGNEVHRTFDYNEKTNKYICKWKNCGKIYSSASILKTHQMRHENRKPFLCITCGKKFITKNSLNSHEKIHLAVKAYNCKLCNIPFSVKSNLRVHEKKYHEGLRFYCTKCTKVYGSKACLERHERVHRGIKEYQCTSCSAAFYTKKELIRHQVYHQDVRKHKCNQCFKTFFEKHHLKIHLRIHTGERPYTCTVAGCDKAFIESQKLRRHIKIEHGN